MARAIRQVRADVLEDHELQALITERIEEDPVFWSGAGRRRTATSIEVEVDDGYVILTGVVRTAMDKRRADILARALGAAGVDNRLRVADSGDREKPGRTAA